jgi:ABC-type uncharacterized transport system involved in gliding motility auxiliary subunit
MVVDYLVWLAFDDKSFDTRDVIFSKIKRLVFATPGNIKFNSKAGTKFTPLLRTGLDSNLFSTDAMVPPSPVKLINSFVPDKTFKTLVARFTGKAQASIAIGKQSRLGQRIDGDINVIVVSDSDMLYDSFWSQRRNVSGQAIVVPTANNQDLLLNALENLSGGAALSGLRGRGIENRPFTLVNDIRKDAESRYRKREKILIDNLKEAQKKLTELLGKASTGSLTISDSDKATIDRIRGEVVTVRRDLRKVQLALNKEILRLEFWLQMANTIAVPLLILFGSLVWWLIKRRRKPAKSGALGGVA